MTTLHVNNRNTQDQWVTIQNYHKQFGLVPPTYSREQRSLTANTPKSGVQSTESYINELEQQGKYEFIANILNITREYIQNQSE